MKSVLISIKPKWCEKIASGEKTVEVRKTRPKIDTPFKVYIYCTKGETIYMPRDIFGKKALNGKVIGEFTCGKVEKFVADNKTAHLIHTEQLAHSACIPMDKLVEYGYESPHLYAWHISDLVIYDKPKELTEFKKAGFMTEEQWLSYLYPNTHCHYEAWAKRFDIQRPPQSWCYVEVEEVKGNG